MSPEEIIRRVKLHNAAQMVLGVGLIPLSLFLWWISFWFFRLAFYISLHYLIDDAWTVTLYVAWLCMIPLAVEGFRHGRPLFDLGEYARSGFYDNFLRQSRSGRVINAYYGNPAGVAFLVSQMLFAAPRTIVVAIKALRSRLPTSADVARHAARILRELRTSRKWTPADEYKQFGAPLMVLDRLHLIWTEYESGHLEIRYPAGEP